MIAQRTRTNPLPFLLLALVVLAFAAFFVVQAVDMTTGHAFFTHASAATVVHDCISRGGTIQIWFNSDTGRRAHLCEVEPGKYGIQIVSQDSAGVWREITAFLKDKMNNLQQVEKYLFNRGYRPLQ